MLIRKEVRDMARTIRMPRNRDVDENLSILVLPKTALPNPLQPPVEVLAAAKEMVFEHTSDGAQPSGTQTTKDDPRMALRNVPTTLDKVTHSFSPTIFFGDEELELDEMLVEGEDFYYCFRDGVPIEDDYAATTQTVDIYAVTVGHKQKNRVTGGKATKTVTLAVNRVFLDVPVAAGA
jgi:hypothetical protein